MQKKKRNTDEFAVEYDKENKEFVHKTTLIDRVDYMDHLKGIEDLTRMKNEAEQKIGTYKERIKELKKFEDKAKELQEEHKKEADKMIKQYSG